LLSGRFSVLASPRSYNNRAGLARTVNELLLPGTDVFIAEMGTYGAGEIAQMVAWLPSEVAVLTAIGPVHLERFGTLRAILEAKREIAVGAKVVVVNDDDELLSALAGELERDGQQVLRCSSHSLEANVAVLERGDDIAVQVEGHEVGTARLGRTRSSIALGNVACAIGAALALGASASEIVPLLQTLPIADNRLTTAVAASGAVIIDDTYNSNPTGTGLALEALVAGASPQHCVVVVSPGMVELGRVQREENARFATAVAKIATHFLIVGRTNRAALLAGARDASLDGARCEIRLVKDRASAVEVVQRDFATGDVVLYENDLPDHYA
jgi:UDP-N-acetylmuramoyl-tripeptide--D-alanyl-D-alanine ligase